MNCEFCGKNYNKKSILRDHLNIHKNIRPYKCDECPKAYFFKKHLNVHKKKHGKPLYECCNIKFYVKDKYVRHKNICGLKYECECGKIYKKKKCYDSHLVKHINDAEKKLEKLLNKKNNNKKMLKRKRNYDLSKYLIVENGAQEYLKCLECGKFLKSKKTFAIHYKKQHLLSKEYKCCCGKEYGYNKDFKKHILNCKDKI